MAYFDTHEEIQHLKNAGISEQEAETIVRLHAKKGEDLATKSDIKLEISELRSELKEDMHKINISMSEIKTDILKWILPFVATNTFAIVGLIITAFWRS
jgi:hypothetical protein